MVAVYLLNIITFTASCSASQERILALKDSAKEMAIPRVDFAVFKDSVVSMMTYLEELSLLKSDL